MLTTSQLILVWTIVPLPLWTAMMVFGWGAMSMLQAATANFAGMMTLRFLIGAFEAGLIPPVALYLTFFYHRGEMGLRYGLFISFSPIANCFASALAYGLVHAKTSIHNWKLLFLVGEYIAYAQATMAIGGYLTKAFPNRGRSNNSSCRRCILLSPCLALRVPVPHTPTKSNHQSTRLQGPWREKRWEAKLQAGICCLR